MRLFLSLIPLTVASASWFGSDTPQYTSWSTNELKAWLVEHNIPVPTQSSTERSWHEALQSQVESNWNTASAWTQDQYTNAQKSFASIRDDSFEAWDESKLRDWLLEQGIVAPKGKKEELVVLARKQYKAYMAAANEWGNWAADSATAGYGTVTSYAAAATNEVEQAMDDTKDYVYSTWDDNRLRSFLEEKGVLKTKQEVKRDELLKMMHDSYASVADPVWNTWATSYMHSWLVNHNIIPPTPTATEKARQSLVAKMNQYYYNVNSYVWDTWSETQLRTWLVDNGIVKKEKEVKGLSREKLAQMVSNSYATAVSTVTSTWSDSEIRDWLIKHDYLAVTDSEKVKREGLIQLFKDKFPQSKDPMSYTPQPYISWPNTRLRAYLIESGVKERDLPQTREDLLKRVGEVWTGAKARSTQDTQALFAKIQSIINGGVERAEEALEQAWDALKGYSSAGVDTANQKEEAVKRDARHKTQHAEKRAEQLKREGKIKLADVFEAGEKTLGSAREKVTNEL